jgi:mannose-1-phosphate guanylyltransferase
MQAIDKANGFIVTFGIVPTNQRQDTDTLKEMAITYFLQRKPNQVSARDFIAKGNFLWNSGMFCFKGCFIRRIEKYTQFMRNQKIAWENNSNGI